GWDGWERAGAVDHLDLVQAGDYMALVAHQGDMQVLSALAVLRDDRRALGIGLVAIPPLLQCQQRERQLPSFVGQAVLVARPAARLAVLRSLEDTLVDQLGQPLGQQVARAAQDAVKLLEARRAV